MQFAQIIGNDELKQQLAQMVDQGRLSHAILLAEEGRCGAVAFAVALAQYLNCENPHDGDSCGVCNSCHKFGKLIHPDLHFAFPVNSSRDLSESEKKSPISDYFLDTWRDLVLNNPYFSEQGLYDAIGIENKSGIIGVSEAKRIFEKLSLRSFEADNKTMIIWLPEKMNQEAANKLLKLLEEPPAGTFFILVSHAPEKLLSTIRSRCQLIRLKPLSRQEKASSGTEATANPEYQQILGDLFEAGMGKKLIDTFPVWELLAQMGREKQREFCLYGENILRKIYMVACGLESVADICSGEEELVRKVAANVRPTFHERAFAAFEEAISAIDSNVNAKLLFCDLCNRILLAL